MLNSQQFQDDPYQNYGITDSRAALNQEFYYNLLRLEQTIQSGVYNLDMVNKTIAHYAKCVEYFDSVNDPVKIYFMEKIQATLVNQKTIMKLLSCTENGEQEENKINQKKRKPQDSFLQMDMGMGNDQQNYLMSPGGAEEEPFNDELNDSKDSQTHAQKKGMRQGLYKMQQEMRKNKSKLQNSSNPQDLIKQQHIRQRQMQILMEAQKGINEVEKGDGQLDTLQDEETNEVKQVKIKGTKDILKDQETFEKQQEEIVQKEMDTQQNTIQQRLLERKKRLQEKRKRKQQELDDSTITHDISVFSVNEHDISIQRKESVNLQDELDQNQQNQNQQQEDQIIQNVSEIFSNDDQTQQNQNQEKEGMNIIINQIENDEEIEETLKDFKNYSKDIQIPLQLQKSMCKAQKIQDLDPESLQQMDQLIQEFEIKNKISKSMTTYELQELIQQQGGVIQQQEQQQQQQSGNSSGKKGHTRNLSAKIIDTRQFQSYLNNIDGKKSDFQKSTELQQTVSTNENEFINE